MPNPLKFLSRRDAVESSTPQQSAKTQKLFVHTRSKTSTPSQSEKEYGKCLVWHPYLQHSNAFACELALFNSEGGGLELYDAAVSRHLVATAEVHEVTGNEAGGRDATPSP